MELLPRFSRILIILVTTLLSVGVQAQVNCANMKRTCSYQYVMYQMLAATCMVETAPYNCQAFESNKQLAPLVGHCTPEEVCREMEVVRNPVALEKACFNFQGQIGALATPQARADENRCLQNADCRKQTLATVAKNFAWGVVEGIKAPFKEEYDIVYGLTSNPKQFSSEVFAGGVEGARRLACFTVEYKIHKACQGAAVALARAGVVFGITRAPETISRSVETAKSKVAAIPGVASFDRAAFVKRLVGRQFTTVAERESYAEIAGRLTPDGKTLVVDVENAEMKNLNDYTGDKNLVTAITNRRLQMMFERLSALKKKYPQVKFASYDDFKSGRVAFEAMSGKLPPGFETDVTKMIDQTNRDFAAEMTNSGIAADVEKAAAAKGKKLPPPDQWFTAGVGDTADMAGKAERQARASRSTGNPVRKFNEPILQRNMSQALRTTERMRTGLAQTSLKNTSLLVKTESGKLIPSMDVFESYRKTPNAAAFARDIEARTGVKISAQTAQTLRNYIRDVDSHSPSLLLVKTRQTVSFAGSKANGVMVDVTSMGAMNLSKEAEALAEARTPAEAVIKSRQSEKAATQIFEANKNAIVKAGNDALAEMGVKGKVLVSGDDIMFQPARDLKPDELQRLQTAIARSASTSNMRISAVGAGIRGADLVGVRGELLEKYVTGKTMGQIENQANYIKMVRTDRSGQPILSIVTRDGSAVPAEVEKIYQDSFAQGLLEVK